MPRVHRSSKVSSFAARSPRGLGLLSALLALGLLLMAVTGAYVVKSMLGINLMAGPSPMHGVFVIMRRAGLV